MTDTEPRPGPGSRPGLLGSPAETETALRNVGYLPDAHIASVVYLAEQLAKPVLVEEQAPARRSSPRASPRRPGCG